MKVLFTLSTCSNVWEIYDVILILVALTTFCFISLVDEGPVKRRSQNASVNDSADWLNSICSVKQMMH